MYCLRFRIPGHESISEAAITILRNALMTATGGQIPAHESISEAAIRILRNALMTATGGQIAFMRASTKIIVLMRALAKIRGEQRFLPWYVCISNLHSCDLQ